MRRNLISYLMENADREADIAISHRRALRRARWSYAGLARLAFQAARELESRGIGRGDHIILVSENRPEWVAVFYAAMMRGAVSVPLDEQSTPDLISRVCEHVDPKLILTGDGDDLRSMPAETIGLTAFCDAARRHSSKPYDPGNIDRDDVAEIVFTSGTTAAPKGVTLTHGNILANLEAIEKVARRYAKWEFLVHPVRIMCLLPLSHVFGQIMGIFIPPMLGAEVVLHNRLNPAEIIETIKRERVSMLASVPRILDTLRLRISTEFDGGLEARIRTAGSVGPLKRLWKFRDVHRRFGWRFWGFISGGARLGGGTEEFWSRLGFLVIQGYGMTETAALVSLNNPFKMRRGSIGEILSGQEVKIGEGGEILVRGPNVAAAPDDEGWLRTGDLGYKDETGRLYFQGRKKDVIVTAAGLNVHPEDVESALAAQPEIEQAAVVAYSGPAGDVPAAAVILKTGADAAAAVERANKGLMPHQRVQRWIVWPEPDLPRTATMKVRRNEVAETVGQLLQGGSTPPSASLIGDVIGRVRNVAGLRPDSRLTEDLNLDSLARVELLSAVEERLNIDVDEQAFTTAETVGDLERVIKAKEPAASERMRFVYPWWSLSAPARWLRTAVYYLLILPATFVLGRVRVEGLENLKGLRGPLLFASNHVTEVDAGLILSALPHRYRSHMAIAMDGERLMSYRYPPDGVPALTRIRQWLQHWLLIALFNVFPLPRKSGFRRSFEYAGAAMDRGYSVMIFPEGGMTTDGRLQELQHGVGLLSQGLETWTVPVMITGLWEQRQQGARFYLPRNAVKVKFGKPIPSGRQSAPQDLVRQLQAQLKELAETSD